MKRITTASGSVYYLDGDLVCRFPGAESNALRKDEGNIKILARGGILVGQPMYFVLTKVSEDPNVVYTSRLTTPVVSIEDLDTEVVMELQASRGEGSSLGEGAATTE